MEQIHSLRHQAGKMDNWVWKERIKTEKKELTKGDLGQIKSIFVGWVQRATEMKDRESGSKEEAVTVKAEFHAEQSPFLWSHHEVHNYWCFLVVMVPRGKYYTCRA